MFVQALCPSLTYLLGHGLPADQLPVREANIKRLALACLGISALLLLSTATGMFVVSPWIIAAPAVIAVAL